MGYCGICNEHYDCHYTVHEDECPGNELPDLDNAEDRFRHEKEQQGWDDDMDKEIWDKHFRFK